MIQLVKNLFINILFPGACLSCNSYLDKKSRHAVVCEKCFSKIPIYDGLFCPVCLRRVPEKNQCHPRINYLLAPVTHYENDTVKKLLHKFKYEGWLSAADPLLELMAQYITQITATGRSFVIVPIPLHTAREKKRGFNQAHIISHYLGQCLQINVLKNNLVRVKNTPAQAETKNYRDREKNIQDAFAVTNEMTLRGQGVILVDDVFTSGATLNEAVRVLKLAGVKKIIALVLARAR